VNKLIKIVIPILLILSLVLTAGCAAKKAVAPPPTPPLPPAAKEYADRAQSGTVTVETGGDIDRRIVKTGYLTLEVDDIANAIADIAGVAKELGGYVVSSNKQGDKDAIYGRISIRVPAERFNEAFDRLRKLAINVPNESTQSQDVTEEYTDLQAQLRNLEATEAQYLELLKKAETVEDMLAVQRELSNVRREIERVKGRIQYLERTSDMALIEVNLQKTQPLGQPGWSALKTFKSAIRGFTTFGRVLADIAIWLVIFSPVWIIILVVVLYFMRWRKRKVKTSR
jgi:hypothetical protein